MIYRGVTRHRGVIWSVLVLAFGSLTLVPLPYVAQSAGGAAHFVVVGTATDAGGDAAGNCPERNVVSANCDLRSAIDFANSQPTGDHTIVTFAPTLTGPFVLSQHTPLTITGAATLLGNGSTATVIDGDGATRAFVVSTGASLTLQHLTVQRGSADNGAAVDVAGSLEADYDDFVRNAANLAGGAVRANGAASRITVTWTTFDSNHASQAGGAVENAGGTVTITGSTFKENQATGSNGVGGAIHNAAAGALTLTNVTLNHNLAAPGGGIGATDGGGGIFADAGTVTATNDTFVLNSSGVAVAASARVNVRNVLLTQNGDNAGGANCTGSVMGHLVSLGNNLDSGMTCLFAGASDQANKPVTPSRTLGFYGGPTETIPFISGYVQGMGALCAPTDQRGVFRPAACDIGAWQSIATSAGSGGTFTVNSIADDTDATPGDGVCEAVLNTNVCTLRAAIQETNTHGGTTAITLPAGTYTLALPGRGEIAAAAGDLNITSNLTLTGAGAGATIVQASTGSYETGLDRVFDVRGGATVTLRNHTIAGGNAGQDDGGGVIVRAMANLTLDGVTVQGNATAGDATHARIGSGIANFGTLLVTNSTVASNTGSGNGDLAYVNGGGIGSTGTLTVDHTLLTGNAGDTGGGLYTTGTATVRSSSLLTNQARTSGAGIAAQGALTVENSTIGANTGRADDPQAIASAGTTTVSASTIAYNASGIQRTGGTVALRGTLLAGNGGANCVGNGGAFTSNDFNLSADRSCAALLTQPHDLNGIDPNLGTSVQGAIGAYPLLAGSPAIDRGGVTNPCPTPADCAVAQNGVARPTGGFFDIGAYEASADTLGPAPKTPAAASTAADSDDARVTLNGMYFLDGLSVQVNGNAATNVRVMGASTLAFVAPRHSVGSVPLVITNPDGQGATITLTYSAVAPAPAPPHQTAIPQGMPHLPTGHSPGVVRGAATPTPLPAPPRH